MRPSVLLEPPLVQASLATDPFIHLPLLRGRLIPSDESELRVTPQVLDLWDQRAREQGRPDDWRMPDHKREDNRHTVLGEMRSGNRDLWVYAYGSLMWDPGFHYAEIRQADLHGYQRRFTYRATMGRGSPEHPGLMLTLESRPGCCRGLAFRVAAECVDAESEILWRREMLRGGYCPTLLPVDTPQGTITALVFAANTEHPEHIGEMPLQKTATWIARASGVLGTNRHYIEQVAVQLATLGIGDEYIEQLLDEVRACCAQCDP